MDLDVFAEIRFHEAVSDGPEKNPETHCDGLRYAILSHCEISGSPGTVATMVSLGTCSVNKLPFVLKT